MRVLLCSVDDVFLYTIMFILFLELGLDTGVSEEVSKAAPENTRRAYIVLIYEELCHCSPHSICIGNLK